MKQDVADKSAAQGLSQSRLPEFTEEEKQRIQGEDALHFLHLFTPPPSPWDVEGCICHFYEVGDVPST